MLYSKAMPMPGDCAENADKLPYDGSKDACDPDNFDKFIGKDEEIVRI